MIRLHNDMLFSLAFRTLLLCLLLLSVQQANADQDVTRVDPPESILFVGNSLTFYNNAIYTHLRKLLMAKDPATRQKIFLKSMTISGAWLADHAGGLKQMLDSRPWDVIVLQGRSREAIEPDTADEFRATLGAFAEKIRSHGAEPVLFMTWAYADRPEMTSALAETLAKLSNEMNLMVIPVGLAFSEALRAIPGVELHDPDGIHPSLTGTYLAAAVFYASLYATSPLELDYDAGLDQELARKLREVAWRTVESYYKPDQG